jgi:hypothetical protein
VLQPLPYRRLRKPLLFHGTYISPSHERFPVTLQTRCAAAATIVDAIQTALTTRLYPTHAVTDNTILRPFLR